MMVFTLVLIKDRKFILVNCSNLIRNVRILQSVLERIYIKVSLLSFYMGVMYYNIIIIQMVRVMAERQGE